MLAVAIISTVISVGVTTGIINREMEGEIVRDLTMVLIISQLCGVFADVFGYYNVLREINAAPMQIVDNLVFALSSLFQYMFMNHMASTITGFATYLAVRIVSVFREGISLIV